MESISNNVNFMLASIYFEIFTEEIFTAELQQVVVNFRHCDKFVCISLLEREGKLYNLDLLFWFLFYFCIEINKYYIRVASS